MVLEAILLGEQPENGWTKAALEQQAGTTPGGIDGLLAGAIDWGLLAQTPKGMWQRTKSPPPIAEPLETLLRLTSGAAKRPIAPLPKRSYRRKDS